MTYKNLDFDADKPIQYKELYESKGYFEVT